MRSSSLLFVCCASVLTITLTLLLLRNIMVPYYRQEFRDVEAEHDVRLTIRNMSRILATRDNSDPWLFVITPTATTLLQEPELLRLGQTLSLPPHIHWVLVMESHSSVEETVAHLDRSLLRSTLREALDYTAVPYTVLEKQTSALERFTKKRFSIGLDWVRSNAPGDAVVMFLEQSTTIDHRLLDQIRWTKEVSSWPLGLLDKNNRVTNPNDWANLGTATDVENTDCSELPAVELQSLAVSVSLLQQSQARLNSSSSCPAALFLHDLLKTGAPLTEVNAGKQGQAYAWKTLTYHRRPDKVLEILKDSNRGSNLDFLHDQLLIDLYKIPSLKSEAKQASKKEG